MKTSAILMTVGLGVVVACNGTETDNPVETADEGPLVHFENSQCKGGAAEDPGQQPLVANAEAQGLQCIDWERDESTLLINLLNFDGPCAAEWDGTARVAEDGALELVLSNPGCLIASCGTCVYDFDFALDDFPSSGDLPVRVAFEDCSDGETKWTHETTLPDATEDSGTVCRPIPGNALSWQALKTDSCGTYHMPCGTPDCDRSATCGAGLTCVELGADDSRCLETCASDADCTSVLTSCQDGLCRPENTF